MPDRNDYLVSIATIISDYRAVEASRGAAHVDQWINQFSSESQLPILAEMNHVLSKIYFSKASIINFLERVLSTDKLTGGDPAKFCSSAKFLSIQQGGGSQREMLALLDALLRKKYGLSVDACGDNPQAFIYLDDAIFTGNRVRRDLEKWIVETAPQNATVYVLTAALHRGGQYYANKTVSEVAKSAGKSIKLAWWRAIELEDRKYYTDTSDVLRPTAIPTDPDVAAYVASMKYAPHLRSPGNVGENALYSSDQGRQVLEQEFLKAGVRIRKMAPHLGDTQRPLGHMTLETLGFGSLIVTFRNCPNNAPLALWAGDPWYPLFPRTTNSETSFANFLAGLKI